MFILVLCIFVSDIILSFCFRLLSEYGFNLDYKYELAKKKNPEKAITESVKDILITHHLFSWEM